ncbi:BtrH N-terminal domain-containing protein [Paenibacillus sp. MMS18-CY102]|uniref:BtrH N-terminal domain-containing protein n=1 Tax=Paenibacillus sp. MMS18-CY102 TaxID=2682849 RepID=UPI0013651D50|nr:BtrH N-terminal domain-containing protein [Paenibacillus sp. MMS18-CY102]MWC27640.1 hypothetical protein [Paenibacillus sp. MMS18-CY102]
MRQLLLHIKNVKDSYPLDYVTCFEKPVAIAAEGMKRDSFFLVYMYLKFMRAYHTNLASEQHIDRWSNTFPHLGLKVNVIPVNAANLIDNIVKELDEGRPVLVGGDLNQLYYSYHYEESHWPHLFLIRGYEDKKKVLHIIDGCQKKTDEHLYEEFVMEYETLHKVFQAGAESYGYDVIYSIEADPKQYSIKEKLIQFIDFMDQYRTDQPFKELDIMKKNVANSASLAKGDLDKVNFELMKITKHKKVLYSELFRMLEGTLPDEARNGLDQLLAAWKLAISKFVLACHRKKEIDCAELVQLPLQYEQMVYDAVLTARSVLEREQERVEPSQTEWMTENNEDGILHILHNRSFHFHFRGDKTYNSWITDDSPKLFFKSLQNNNLAKDFTIQVELEVVGKSRDLSYHAGFVLRTKTGDMYFWGMNCGESLMLSHIGNTNIAVEVLEHDSVGLLIEKEHDCYHFSYRQEGKVNRISALNNLDVAEIGLVCKTWDEANELSVHFTGLTATSSLNETLI